MTPMPTPTPTPIFSPKGMPPEAAGVGDANCDVVVIGGGVGGVGIDTEVVGSAVKEARAALKDPGFSARIFAPQVSTADFLPHPKSVAV